MAKDFDYTEEERQRNRVLEYQRRLLNGIKFDSPELEKCISDTEETLKALGKEDDIIRVNKKAKAYNQEQRPAAITLPTWEQLSSEANNNVKDDISLKDFFTNEELEINRRFIEQLNEDFNAIHHLDTIDWTISAVAGIVSAAVDILFVGIPGPSETGVKAGSLSNYIREYFEKKHCCFPKLTVRGGH